MDYHYASRPADQPWRDFFAAQFDQQDEDRVVEVLAVSAPAEGVCYGAYRTANRNTGEERVSAIVIELDLSRDGEVGFNAVTEFDGPAKHQCPPEVYALLTKLRHCDESPLAKNWRARAEAWQRAISGRR